MRTVPHQSELRPVFISHEHSDEFAEIDRLLGDCPEAMAAVERDLLAGVANPDTGRQGMSAEQVIRVLIVKQVNGFSYKQLAFHLVDSQTYRAFCRLGAFGSTPKASTLQDNMGKVKPETLELLNQSLLGIAREEKLETGRKIRVDSTAIEANVHAPSDSSLLWDCTRSLVRLLRQAKPYRVGFRDRRRAVKTRTYRITFMRGKERRAPLYREVLLHVRALVRDAERAVRRLHDFDDAGALRAQLEHYLDLTRRVIDQTERRVLQGESVPAAEKIVSIFEPHTDIIRKGTRDTVFGHKLFLTVGRSLVLDAVVESGNPADSTLTQTMIERHAAIWNAPPKQAVFDGGFCSRANLDDLKDAGVQDVVFTRARHIPLDHMAKSTWVYRNLKRFRAGIEGIIGYLKMAYGLRRCTWHGFAGFKTYVWASVVSANLMTLARHRMAAT
jgi:IS5 family transposase